MKGVCIIPARGGSRRIPRKNIKFFHGKPIIAYSIDVARKADVFDKIFVSTDDAEIASAALLYGADVLKRPPELSLDEIGTQEVMKHACEALKIERGCPVCCLYATSPLIKMEDLRWGYYRRLFGACAYVISVGIEPLRDAGAFYFGSASDFLEDYPLWTFNTAIWPLPPERVCDINTPDDWARAEAMYEALYR